MLLQEFLQKAIIAHNGISFSPEKRGEQTIKEFSQQLAADLALIEKICLKYSVSEANIESIKARYQDRYQRLFGDWLNAKANCISVMIAGPSNFPTRRAQNANNSERNKFALFQEWRERFIKSLERTLKPKETVSTTLEAARKNLAEREKLQELMKRANAIIRKAKGQDCTEQLIKAGIKMELAKELQSGEGKWYGVGFASFELRNNNAEIKRLRERIALLEAKEKKQQEVGTAVAIEHDGVKVVNNYDLDRVQIIFSGKPNPEVITMLKKNAFKWSPKNSAWQRKITVNAEKAAQQIIEQIKNTQS